MRACSFVCTIIVLFMIIDQFYSGLNYERLFICGVIAIAIWTDCERWFRYKIKRKKHYFRNN